jgi:phosphonate transport system permease protein
LPRAVTIPPDAQLEPLLRVYRSAVAAKQRRLVLGVAILAVCVLAAGAGAEVDADKFWQGIGNFGDYFDRLLILDSGERVWTDPAEWFWGIRRWTRLLGETLLIAYVGTLTGTLGAFIGGFLCSRNLVRAAWLRILVRRALEFCRTVPDIVFALIFVASFGLGAMSGVLAIAIHTTGALGKLFCEVVENIDIKPVEGIALPQVLSNFASYALLRFEINVRGATVLGVVGAGGIGQDLITAIRQFHGSDVSAILVLIILCVMLIDAVSERLRHRLLSLERAR